MRCRSAADVLAKGERGSVTAEFAAVVPAILLVLAACLGCLQLASQQLRLQDAAAATARALARGDAPPSLAGAAVATHREGDLLCARLTSTGQTFLPGVTLSAVTLTAQSCALA